MTADLLRALIDKAEAEFAFLFDLGFEQTDHRMIGSSGSFKDGWKLAYRNTAVYVTILYSDVQLEITFERDGHKASYLFLDKDLFAWKSGLHGDMFPPQKLEPVIEAIASDVRENYKLILSGDQATWNQIQRLLQEPSQKPRLPI